MTNGQIWIGNALNIPTAQTISGDATLSNAGLFTIGVGAVTTGKIFDGTLLFADFAANGCLNGEIFKYNGSAWVCGTDVSGGGGLSIGTIDSIVKSANGAVVSGSNLILQTADATNPGLVSTTTQAFAGNKTFADGLNLSTSTIEGAGLISCNSSTSKLTYNSTTKKFECAAESASANIVTIRKTAPETLSTASFQADDHISLPVAAGEKWAFVGYLNTTAGTNIQTRMTLPSNGAICYNGLTDTVNTRVSNSACGTGINMTITSPAVLQYFGSFTVGTTGGTAIFEWSPNTGASTTTLGAGSYMTFYKITGADLAEVYYSDDTTISEGDIVALGGAGASQVQKSNKGYQSSAIGIVSTKPGLVLSESDGTGKPVIVGLSGRVPVKVSGKNGAINPGDYITTSDIPGVGMRATRAGHVIGKALTGIPA